MVQRGKSQYCERREEIEEEEDGKDKEDRRGERGRRKEKKIEKLFFFIHRTFISLLIKCTVLGAKATKQQFSTYGL